MSDHSTIEWCDATWNPVRGCVKISPGCKHCYASTFAERFRGVAGHPYERGFDPRMVPDKLDEPLRWKKPRRIFVNSMSDMFHDEFEDGYITQVCVTMQLAAQHTYQVLTKRSERLRDFLNARPMYAMMPHVWWGVSVEDRKYGLPRIGHLQAARGVAKRILSIEPLLEDLGPLNLDGIAWVIVGGESGHGARPMHPDWVRSIRDPCIAVGVPFFFKQWGQWAWATVEDDAAFAGDLAYDSPLGGRSSINPLRHVGERLKHYWWADQRNVAILMKGKKSAGRELDGRTWDEYPK